jgi:hypothetical protein
LANLLGDFRAGIVGKPMVLPGRRRELGLQKQRAPGEASVRNRPRHGGADAGLDVVTTLVRRVDAPKAVP